MSIKLLPHWVVPDKYPAFYDVESATAVEQTSKLYGKMQELIEDYNKYVEEINNTITEFAEGIILDQEEFKNKITKIIHDYISMIDEKIKQQDYKIEEYLSGAIEDLLNELVESGELKNVITTYDYDFKNKTLVLKMGGAN